LSDDLLDLSESNGRVLSPPSLPPSLKATASSKLLYLGLATTLGGGTSPAAALAALSWKKKADEGTKRKESALASFEKV